MLRQIRNGILGALAIAAALYVLGLVGVLLQGTIAQQWMDWDIAIGCLIFALGIGILVLKRLSRPSNKPDVT